jgi:hypothetical protein
VKRVIETLSLLLLVSGFSVAQTPQSNWDNLKQLRPGQKIEVADSSMKTLKGAFVSFSDEAIALRVGKSGESVLRANVVRVSVRDTSHRTRNVLLGAGILGGVALGVITVPLAMSGDKGSHAGAYAAAIAVGLGGGAALGTLPGSRTIYRVKKQ